MHCGRAGGCRSWRTGSGRRLYYSLSFILLRVPLRQISDRPSEAFQTASRQIQKPAGQTGMLAPFANRNKAMYQKKNARASGRGWPAWRCWRWWCGSFYALGNILTPFIVAAVLAYILNPLVEKLRDKGMKRGLAAMLVMIFSLVLILALTLVIVPMLVNQFNNIGGAAAANCAILCKTKCCRGSNMLLGGHLTLDTPSIVAWPAIAHRLGARCSAKNQCPRSDLEARASRWCWA